MRVFLFFLLFSSAFVKGFSFVSNAIANRMTLKKKVLNRSLVGCLNRSQFQISQSQSDKDYLNSSDAGVIGASGVLSSSICTYSLYVLKTTGCGIFVRSLYYCARWIIK